MRMLNFMCRFLDKNFVLSLLAIAVFAGAPQADAADDTGQYLVMGLGNSTCNSYLAEDEAGIAYYLSWLAGYMTTYNHLQEDTYSILGKTKDVNQIESWLRDYCTVNGNETFESAVRNLLRNLKYFRQKKKQ